MLIVMIILLIIVIIIQLFLNNKLNKTRREMSGLPISSTFPVPSSVKLNASKNYMMVVSTNCTVCQRIFKELNNRAAIPNLYLVFKNSKKDVDAFIQQHPHLKNAHIITSVNPESLFIKTTPLTYEVDQKGRIQDKKSIVSLKELDIK